MQIGKRTLLLAAAAALLGTASRVRAHGSADHATKREVVKEQTDWGIAGEAKAARRSIEVRMLDTMRFEPDRIAVRLGETLRIVVVNTGAVMHEFVIGTREENEKHAALMLKFPNMEHDAPYMAHVAPGKRGEIVWTFNRPGRFEFACLIAGHYSAGMVGTIDVASAKGG